LLPEGQDLKSGITPTAKENPECGKAVQPLAIDAALEAILWRPVSICRQFQMLNECEDRVDHELTLLTRNTWLFAGRETLSQVADFTARYGFVYEHRQTATSSKS
jgi:hypothetical protein